VLGAGQRPDLQLHQSMCGKADHLTYQIGVTALFQKSAKVHHLVGHPERVNDFETAGFVI
jgi:hypothetical protein